MTGAVDAGLGGRSSADWLLCRAGAGLCALPLAHIVEIMRLLPIEPVASPPPGLKGLSLIRGAPVPVLDLAALLGESGAPVTRLVTAIVADRKVALAVEAVLGVRRIESDLVSALPPMLRDPTRAAVAALGALDAELLLMLETGKLVPPELFDRLDTEATP